MRRISSFLIVLSFLLGTLCPGISLQLGHPTGMHGISVSSLKMDGQHKTSASHSETPDKDCIEECLSRLAGSVDSNLERKTSKPVATPVKQVELTIFTPDPNALQSHGLFGQITAFKLPVFAQTQRYRL